MTTQFHSWTVTQNFGVSTAYGGAAGIFNFRLHASDPVPGSLPESRPFTINAPTANVRHVRRRVPDSPSIEVTPQPALISGLHRTRLRTEFNLRFVGAGGGPGVDLAASASTASDFSTTGSLHFIGQTLSAQEMLGEGMIIDGGITPPNSTTVYGIQILLINSPTTIVGGLASFAQRLERAISQASTNDLSSALGAFLRPSTIWAIVATEAHGLSVGLTLFGGLFSVH
jgi:hypothetical protein